MPILGAPLAFPTACIGNAESIWTIWSREWIPVRDVSDGHAALKDGSFTRVVVTSFRL
jgi:hypothetical protein